MNEILILNYMSGSINNLIRTLVFVIGVYVSYSCNRVNFTDYGYIRPNDTVFVGYEHLEDTIVSYDLSLRADTVDIRLTNISDKTILLFDGYFLDRERDFHYVVLVDDILYRYNPHKDIFKISFLPLVQYLTYVPWDVIVIGRGRVTRGFQVLYSFRPIKQGETICISLPFKFPRADTWIEDIDTRDYNVWEARGKATVTKIKKSEKQISQTENPEVCMEFALYCDTTGLSIDDFFSNTGRFNNRVKCFKTLCIPLTKDIIEMIFMSDKEFGP